MSFSIATLRGWHTGLGYSLNNWRTVATANQSATATTLPRYTRWGSGNTLKTTGGSFDLNNAQHLWFDAIQVRIRFHLTDNVNATSSYKMPRGSNIYNATTQNINITNNGSWYYIKSGTTNLVAVRGWYSGRYTQSGAWYGTGSLKRVYYYIYQANRAYIIRNNSSITLCGNNNGSTFGTVTNTYAAQTAEYCSFIIKNRTR